MADAEVIRRVTLTCQKAQTLRESAKAAIVRAEALIRHATALCARYKTIEKVAAEKFVPFSGAAPRIRQRFHARGFEIVEQLKESLSDLETIRLIPADDPKLRELKEDIRKSIERAEIAGRD